MSLGMCINTLDTIATNKVINISLNSQRFMSPCFWGRVGTQPEKCHLSRFYNARHPIITRGSMLYIRNLELTLLV